MVAAKALGSGILVVTFLASLGEAGEIISAGGGVRAFLDQRAAEQAPAPRQAFLGSFVQAGSGATVSAPRFATPAQTSVAPPSIAPFVPAPPAAPVAYAAPVIQAAAPAPAATVPTASYDAFVNFGTAAFAGQSSLTTGNALPWFSSDAAVKAYGGVPTAQQVQDFGKTVLDRVASTFAQSGLNIRVTDDPSASANHMLSVASGLSSSTSPGAIGVSTVGQDGFSFIDKLAYATSPDQLMWAVAHNVAHELMHTFGGSHHTTVEGGNLDAAVADWSVLIDPNTKFSAESVAEMTRNIGQGGLMSRSGSYAQMLEDDCHDHEAHEMLAVNGVPVPEPATMALWGGMIGLGAFARRRAQRRASV